MPEKGDIEETVFPHLAKQRRLKAVFYKDAFEVHRHDEGP